MIMYSAIVALNDDEERVEALVNELHQVLGALKDDYEIIFVDDGSSDATLEKLLTVVDHDARVRVIRMRSRFGEASALNAGLDIARGTTILYSTSRVRIDFSGFTALVEKLQDGFDLVFGWRSPRADSRLNRIISRSFNALTARLSGLKLHDINSGVMVSRKEVLDSIKIYGEWAHFLPVLAHRQGYRVTEEKIAQRSGRFRKSRYVGEYLQRLLDIITVIFLSKYSQKPIHFMGFVGLLFILSGAVIDLYLFVYRILGLGPIAGRPLLLLGSLLLVIGIQMVSIGLLGEMIIFTHAGEIQEYNIEQIVEKIE